MKWGRALVEVTGQSKHDNYGLLKRPVYPTIAFSQ